MAEGELRQLLDRVDGPVAVVARGSDESDGVRVDRPLHPLGVDQRGRRVDRGDPSLDPEEVAGLVERRVGRLRLDHVGTVDPALAGRVVAIGEQRMADAAGAACRDEAGRLGGRVDRLGVEQIEGHGDDLGLELRRARAHVPLEHVHVGEQTEGLVEEAVVVVVPAVHRPRAAAPFPGRVLLHRHGVELLEDRVARRAPFGEVPVDGEPAGVGEGAHRRLLGCSDGPLGRRRLHGTRPWRRRTRRLRGPAGPDSPSLWVNRRPPDADSEV